MTEREPWFVVVAQSSNHGTQLLVSGVGVFADDLFFDGFDERLAFILGDKQQGSQPPPGELRPHGSQEFNEHRDVVVWQQRRRFVLLW